MDHVLFGHCRIFYKIIVAGALASGCGTTPSSPIPTAPIAQQNVQPTALLASRPDSLALPTAAPAATSETSPAAALARPTFVPTTASTQLATSAPPTRAPATPQAVAPAVAPAVDRQPASITITIPTAARAAVNSARNDLAQRLGIALDAIEVVGVQQRYKSSGASDTAGRPDGWLIGLAAGTTRYVYQVDARGRLSYKAEK